MNTPSWDNSRQSRPDLAKQSKTPAAVNHPADNLTQDLPDLVKQLDTTATTNMTVAGVLISFYAGAIFAGKVTATVFNALIYALPICFLLVTLILAIRVFYPDGYLTDDYATLIKKKEQRLKWSSLSLEAAVGLLILSVIFYLLRPS